MSKEVLPNLVIIGAMKSGTTSIHGYLALHPQIYMSQHKELDFFIDKKNWHRGLKWYQSNFRRSGDADVVGESSPNYSKYPFFQGVAEKMHRVIPDAKLIYMVRDPIKRISSHYIHRLAIGQERKSFSEALTDLKTSHYLNCTRYYTQLEQFLAYYPSSRIMTIALEELASNPKQILKKVFSFLGVNPNYENEEFSVTLNPSARKMQPTDLGLRVSVIPGGRRILRKIVPQLIETPIEKPFLNDSLRQAIFEELQDDIEKLKKFTGSDFEYWDFP